jgi:hypothetical protein
MSLLKQPIFVFLFWLLFTISLLHHIAIFFYLYWTVWWFDMVMHFLGGMGMATSILWLIFWSGILGKHQSLPLWKAFFIALTASLVIGILWEIFEIYGGIIVWPDERPDSISDLILDMIGGLAAFLNSLRYRKNLAYGN